MPSRRAPRYFSYFLHFSMLLLPPFFDGEFFILMPFHFSFFFADAFAIHRSFRRFILYFQRQLSAYCAAAIDCHYYLLLNHPPFTIFSHSAFAFSAPTLYAVFENIIFSSSSPPAATRARLLRLTTLFSFHYFHYRLFELFLSLERDITILLFFSSIFL